MRKAKETRTKSFPDQSVHQLWAVRGCNWWLSSSLGFCLASRVVFKYLPVGSHLKKKIWRLYLALKVSDKIGSHSHMANIGWNQVDPVPVGWSVHSAVIHHSHYFLLHLTSFTQLPIFPTSPCCHFNRSHRIGQFLRSHRCHNGQAIKFEFYPIRF